jgi:hypothetical protein
MHSSPAVNAIVVKAVCAETRVPALLQPVQPLLQGCHSAGQQQHLIQVQHDCKPGCMHHLRHACGNACWDSVAPESRYLALACQAAAAEQQEQQWGQRQQGWQRPQQGGTMSVVCRTHVVQCHDDHTT